VLTLSPNLAPPDEPTHATVRGMSRRPAFTHLILLATADPGFARCLLYDPVKAALSHRHYPIQLSAVERALLQSLCEHAQTSDELLIALAEYADGAAEGPG
jgi:hypothetical protein